MQEWNEGTWEAGQILRSVLFTGVDPEKDIENLKLNCCVNIKFKLFLESIFKTVC